MRARLATSVVLASLIVAGTAGCTFITPQATQYPYDSSDGISGEVGDVRVINTMLITNDGETAALLGAFVNSGSTSATVKVQYEDASGAKVDETIHVNASSTKSLGVDGELVLSDLDAQPGTLFPIYIQYGSEPGVELHIPVLDGTLDTYSDVAP